MLSTTRPTDPTARGTLGAAPVRLEPCVAFLADADGGPCCAECGWAADDHDVIEVPARAAAS